MKKTTKIGLWVAVLVSLALAGATPVVSASDLPQFEVTAVMPTVTDPQGNLLPIVVASAGAGGYASAFNNRGQVSLVATDGRFRSLALRYSPDLGLEVLTKNSAKGWTPNGINEDGQMPIWRIFPKFEYFFFDDDVGLVRMRRGLKSRARRRLLVTDLNDHGHVFASYFDERKGGCVAVLYTLDDGWSDLSSLDEGLTGACSRTINNSGDLGFVVPKTPPPGQTHGRAIQISYLLQDGEELVELGNLGLPTTVIGEVNERGWLAGLSVDLQNRERAVQFRPGRKLQEINPDGFDSSYTRGITSKGLVAIVASESGKEHDAVFTYDRKKRFTMVASRADFEALLERAGRDASRVDVDIYEMNDRGEMVGAFNRKDGDSREPRLQFLIRPGQGLFALQEIVDASGRDDLKVTGAEFINDRGQIALTVERPEMRGVNTTAILTPADTEE